MIDVNKIRKDFPMLQGRKMQGHDLIYFDNAATTFKPQSVIDAVTYYYTNLSTNAHRGDYELSFYVDQAYDACRKAAAKFINAEEKEIARICTDAILSGDTDTLYEHLSPRLAEYMPRDVYLVVRKDTLAPLGDFVSIDKTVADDRFSNKLHCFIRYSKLGLKITYVFHGGKIDGLWFGYYDTNKR